MITKCKRRIDEICSSPLYKGLSICGRVTVANATLLGTFWYTLPLWAGTREDLDKIEKQVLNFVWNGLSVDTRHRVAKKITIQKIEEGGLGLVSMAKQYLAFATRTIRWAYQPGEHPMKLIIQRGVEKQTYLAFGTVSPQWLYSKAKYKDAEVSQPGGTGRQDQNGELRGQDSPVGRRLPSRHLGDLMDATGEDIVAWEQRRIKGIDSKNAEKAYNSLKEKVTSWNAIRRTENGQVEQAFEETHNRRVVWEWKVRGKLKSSPQLWPEHSNVVRCYVEEKQRLRPHQEMLTPTSTSPLHPVDILKFRVGQGRTIVCKAEGVTEDTQELARLTWMSGDDFFMATNGRLRQMLSRDKQALIDKLHKWSDINDVQLVNKVRWRAIWAKGRARKESFLLWSIIMSIVPNNGWRFPALLRSDPLRWCKRCEARAVEDTLHTFWECQQAAKIWRRIKQFFVAAQPDGAGWNMQYSHALLADKLPRNLKSRESWWETVRGATCWGIWLARNAKNFSNENWHEIKTANVIWYRITLYTKLEWRKLKGPDKREEQEVFKTAWAFEYAGIEEDDAGNLVIPRQAPWSRRENRSSVEEESTGRGQGRLAHSQLTEHSL
ncbi:hypothetical protein R1sor_016440 [Riccia sorocarpa]|uniref:Reverse transcriptase zinc-binding domain-containing protein n=1 Tax=Riccia sorocarpa TaxID=122646 RepID=A0ABD3HJ55_9MARC